MLREASSADLPRIEAFLSKHTETSMYLRGNLQAHGVGHGDHAHSTQVFLWEEGEAFGVFGMTKSGYLMAQMPDMPEEAATAFANAIMGRSSLGMTGDVPQVEMVMRCCGLSDAEMALFHDEPLFRLDLSEMPKPDLTCRRPTPDDQTLLERWVAAYLFDTGQDVSEGLATNAAYRTKELIEDTSAGILLRDGEPVAMARINAKAGDTVQVGGVYVPNEHRGHGYAGQVTLALLETQKAEGAQTAILFANNEPAARAYEKIGFSQIGQYRIALLKTPCEVRP